MKNSTNDDIELLYILKKNLQNSECYIDYDTNGLLTIIKSMKDACIKSVDSFKETGIVTYNDSLK